MRAQDNALLCKIVDIQSVCMQTSKQSILKPKITTIKDFTLRVISKDLEATEIAECGVA